MRIDKTKISGVQFMLLLACFIQASGLLTSFVSAILMQDSWMAVIFASVSVIPLIFLYKKLITKFPGQNLFQIFEIVFGKVVGKIISLAFLVYFITIALLNLSDMADFSKLTIMKKTPDIVIIGISVFVSGFAIRYGIKAISRYSFIFLIFSMFVLFITCILLANQFDFSNFLPIFAQEPIRYVQGTHILLAIPLGEFLMFLMFTQNVQVKKRDWSKYLFGGFFLGIFLLLIVKIRDIALLGNIYHILALPQLLALKLVNLGDALSRMEVLFAVVLILMLYLKATILIYSALMGICQIFEVKEYWNLIPIFSVFLIVLSQIFINFNSESHLAIGRKTVPFTWVFFQYLIPFLTLFIAIIFKKTTEKRFGVTNGYLKNTAIYNFQKIKSRNFKKEVGV